MRPALGAFKAALTELIGYENANIAATAEQAQQTYIASRNQLLGLGALAIVIAGALGYAIRRALLKQLGGEPD